MNRIPLYLAGSNGMMYRLRLALKQARAASLQSDAAIDQYMALFDEFHVANDYLARTGRLPSYLNEP